MRGTIQFKNDIGTTLAMEQKNMFHGLEERRPSVVYKVKLKYVPELS